MASVRSNKNASHPSSLTNVSHLVKNKRMALTDLDDSLSSLPIQILIGADFYWNVMHSDAPVKLLNSLSSAPSSYGWILSGSRLLAMVYFNPTVHNINVDSSTQELDNVVLKILELREHKHKTNAREIKIKHSQR
ncbi:hypothetical protein TNCT_697621 [Trichonephila clavata]|uniref:Uncharacterized protein n=1 Tax=Trichonephila clavata TaxID=2740835 RepID=A0A8X6HIK0_TRICU|nr:hypothetical protein TNCT_697621 [Trichonephila clavata]